MSSQRGVGRLLRFLREVAGCARDIGLLLERNGFGFVAHVDLEPRRARRDRQPLIAELTDDVERLARRLLERESELVRGDRAFDLRAHVRRRLEEAVRRDQTVERLMRSLEVVVAEEMLEALLRVAHVREHGPAEKLVPQRLPEPLDLAERLRVLRPTANVVNPHARQRLLELRLAAPHGVLPSVVGQHFRRLAVCRHAAFERLHHQRGFLVMRERVPDDESAVVVHEHADVQPLGATESKRENVGLPELIGRRPLESTWRMLALRFGLRRLNQPFLVQDAADLLLAHTERLEARQYVTNPPSAPVLVLPLEADHLLPHHGRCLQAAQSWFAGAGPFGLQCRRSMSTERGSPLLDRCRRDTECGRDIFLRRSLHAFLNDQKLVRGRHLATPATPFLLVRHRVSVSADLCQRVGDDSAR